MLRDAANPNSPRREATPQVVESWHIRRYTADLASRIEILSATRRDAPISHPKTTAVQAA
ncbi:hypothetical protein RHOER0001_5506 [Rhodococcus erythropolis SK121]|nr:hypothetical protein RHOER0001_5506 [Rhodococcus erythropolis SK121]